LSAQDETLNVTIVGLNYAPEPTGIAPYTSRMAAGLQERGHDVRVLTTHPHYPDWKLPADAPWSSIERHCEVPVRRVRHYVPSNPGSSVRRALSEVSFGMRAAATRWGSPDVVICPSPALLSTAVAMTRATARGPAFGVIVQDLYSAGVSEASGRGSAAVRALGAVESRVLRKADGVAVIHDRFKQRVVDSLAVDASRVSVIRNWTHLPRVPMFDEAEFRAQMGWGTDEIVVLHAGAMGEKQGLDVVVSAARVADERNLPVRFVLLGNGGQRAQLEGAALGCTKIDFRDPLPGDDYLKAMAAADVLLVNERPGVLEMAVPSKLTSYFSTGRPVLAATDARSITAAEVTAAGAGVVVEPGQPVAILEGALQLATDRGLAADLGARGPIYCETHLSEKTALDGYDEWVRTVYETHRNKK